MAASKDSLARKRTKAKRLIAFSHENMQQGEIYKAQYAGQCNRETNESKSERRERKVA